MMPLANHRDEHVGEDDPEHVHEAALRERESEEEAEGARREVRADHQWQQRLKGFMGQSIGFAGGLAKRAAPGKLFLFILAAIGIHLLDIYSFNFDPLNPVRFILHFGMMVLGIAIFKTENRKQDIVRFLFLFAAVMFLGVVTRGMQYLLMEYVFRSPNEVTRLFIGTLLNAHLLPLWVLYALLQETVEQTWFTRAVLLIGIIMLLFAFYSVVPEVPRSFSDVQAYYASLPAEEREQAQSFFERVQSGAQQFWGDVSGGVRRAVVGQIEYAAGDYYTGRVDENREEPLGVYIENLQADSDVFFEDEPITVWATLKAKTLDPAKPITVDVSCSSDIGGTDCRTQRISGDVNPDPALSDITYQIFGREYQDLSCEFPAHTLSQGNRDIRFSALFDFTTDAYLKVYFIDLDRSRALVRANIDPFDEYDVRDRNPVAVYSNGPVSIGAGTSEPLVALSPNRDFRFGITFQNGWDGKIVRLKNLIIKIPETMELVRCDQPVQERPCESDECEGGTYTRVWVLNLLSRQLTDITDARTFSCRVHTRDVQAALGGVPLATKYFKIRAEYVYAIEERVGANVQPSEGADISCRTDAGNPRTPRPTQPSGPASVYASIQTPYDAAGEDNRIRNLIALYGPTVDEVRSRYPNVPRPLVFAVVAASSVSGITHPSAVGVMGIHPAHSTRSASELADPQINIDEGMRILSTLITRFGNDYRRALVAYTVNPDDNWVGGVGDPSYARWASTGYLCWAESCDATPGSRSILPVPRAQDFANRAIAYLQRSDVLIGQTAGRSMSLGAAVWPLPQNGAWNKISDCFNLPGETRPRAHVGVDIEAGAGSDVYAITDGIVGDVGENGLRGRYIDVSGNAGYSYLFFHLNEVLKSRGESVSKGEVIAHSGNTGESTGPHVHLETFRRLVDGSRDYFNPLCLYDDALVSQLEVSSMDVDGRPNICSLYHVEDGRLDTRHASFTQTCAGL